LRSFIWFTYGYVELWISVLSWHHNIIVPPHPLFLSFVNN
jgi:hypothetical protein